MSPPTMFTYTKKLIRRTGRRFRTIFPESITPSGQNPQDLNSLTGKPSIDTTKLNIGFAIEADKTPGKEDQKPTVESLQLPSKSRVPDLPQKPPTPPIPPDPTSNNGKTSHPYAPSSKPSKDVLSRFAGSQPPLSGARLSVDGTDTSSDATSSAIPDSKEDLIPYGQRPFHDFEVNILPPSRANTTEGVIEQNNIASLGRRLAVAPKLRGLSPLRLSSSRPSSPSGSSSGSRSRSPPPEITEGSQNDCIFPNTIPVILNLTFDEKPVPAFTSNSLENFQWTIPENYKQLVPDGFMSKHQHDKEELRTQEIYLRYGTCQVKGPSGLEYESLVSIVKDHEELSEHAIRAICGFIEKYPYQLFELKVQWDYGSAQIKRPTKEQVIKGTYNKVYAAMIQKEIKKKEQKNFKGLTYIPRRDLDVFLRPYVVENVVREDETLQLGNDSRNQFITDIQSVAPKLFAICVYHGLTMAFLEHLMGAAHRCQDIPKLRPKMNTECKRGYCSSFDMSTIVNSLPSFFAEKISRNYQHVDLTKEKVLPLHNVGEIDVTGYPSRKELGEGAFGKVFAVKINLAHNDGDAIQGARNAEMQLEPLVPAAGYESPEKQFAIKEFSDAASFEQERKILRHLARYKHPHIVLHLTTWTQDKCYYILYDLARCNLREYITTVDPPPFSKSHVVWFLRQLDGLAKAIFHVHHFNLPESEEPGTAVKNTGRHNDIKPENILVFERAPNQNPSFKIADFGQSVFAKSKGEVSRKTRNVRGTETYWAPDFDKAKEVSRPFDMWALGCVYLELLLWLFRFFQDNHEPGFTTRRQDFPEQESRDKDDRFWLVEGRGRSKVYTLKPAVSGVIEELKTKHCKAMPAFSHVLRVIDNLLRIEPDKRMSADKLMITMASIVSEATSFCSNNPDFYHQRYRKNIGKSDISVSAGTEIMGHNLTEQSHSPISRSPSPDNIPPSRTNSMRQNTISNLTTGSKVHHDQEFPGNPGDIERDLEHISASVQSLAQP